MLRIAVIGASYCDQKLYQIAYSVGWEIAQKGSVLYCGGLGGVMEAAAKGAKAGDGVTIGILPTLNANDANSYIDHPICTGASHARNLMVVASVDVIIAIGGEYGTLSEIALALKLQKPVICLASWKLDAPIIASKTPVEAVLLAHSALKSDN